MSRNKTILLILTGCLMGGLISCSKNPGAEQPYHKIQGKWKLSATASDGGNGLLIYQPVPAAQDYEITFNSDGTGIEEDVYYTQIPSQGFSWAIKNGDSVWIAKVAHDTTIYYLAELNATRLRLAWKEVTSTGFLAWNGKEYIKK